MRGISGSDRQIGRFSESVLRLWLAPLKASNLTRNLSLRFGAGARRRLPVMRALFALHVLVDPAQDQVG